MSSREPNFQSDPFNVPNTREQISHPRMNISNSRLEPNAPEFYPSWEPYVGNNRSTGAIRKNRQQNYEYGNGRANNRSFGSGRTFHSRPNASQETNQLESNSESYQDDYYNRGSRNTSKYNNTRNNYTKPNNKYGTNKSYENVEFPTEHDESNNGRNSSRNNSGSYYNKNPSNNYNKRYNDYENKVESTRTEDFDENNYGINNTQKYRSGGYYNKPSSGYNKSRGKHDGGQNSTENVGQANEIRSSEDYERFGNRSSTNYNKNSSNYNKRYDNVTEESLDDFDSGSSKSFGSNSYKNRPSNFQKHNKYSYNDEQSFGRNYARNPTVDFEDENVDTKYGDDYYRHGRRNGYGDNRGYGKPNENRYQQNRYKDGNGWRNKNSTVVKGDKKKLNTADQRDRLTEMINRRLLECLVCCEKIKVADKTWSCMQCYHILHLKCISVWAESSKAENGWRCPACQNVLLEIPTQYKCYCGKQNDPKYDAGVIAHGCGDMCLRKYKNCEHKCTILCHPGPCPDCEVMTTKFCGCGATKQTVKCCSTITIVCNEICTKTLECGIHKCTAKCHLGPCAPCDQFVIQECYCGQTGRKVPCTSESSKSSQYSCDNICENLLSCGNHKCQKICHKGPCDVCDRDITLIHGCHCGKTPLASQRSSCLDPIPCCDKVCGKRLICGQPNDPHRCNAKCHEGPCPPCSLTTVMRCRCGHMDKELPCHKVTSKADDARCDKKCTKKRTCGKHRCNQRCCIDFDHICPLPCNHQLTCGKHRCQLTCHSGRCPPCMETSFEELYCECGASVIYPPVPCGTKPPECDKPCQRERPCGHPTNHTCHSGACPPCIVLTKRWCHGRHEQRGAIPCYQETFSCGLPCGKPMPCGRHKCDKPCHDGKCPVPCKQPCVVQRSLCGHPCNKPCHDPPCPESNCKHMVPITCQCGLQKRQRPCMELTDEFRNIEMAQFAEKLGGLAKDQTVDISDIGRIKKPTVLKILECNENCRVVERNRRLEMGLQIRNPDLTQKLTPRYSDFMRQWAKKDPVFCQKVHDRLYELVRLSKESLQKSRSYSFESMNKDKRHFVHEYCEHFGVDSAAYDAEPNRNVVATAIKDKSWLPSMSLMEVIQRENGHRKVPGPVMSKSNSITGKSETVSLKLGAGRASQKCDDDV